MSFDAAIEAALSTRDWRVNPYFAALRDHSFAREDFVETQIQFLYAVTFFSRPMAMLAAKIPDTDRRLPVVRNVWEEHGEGELEHAHGLTFRELLHRLGTTDPEIEKRTLWPEIRIFDTALLGMCLMDDWRSGAAAMGAIERMFQEISSWIGRGIVDNGWLPREHVVHYHLHEELDLRHSADFFELVRPEWSDPRSAYAIVQGTEMGVALFDDLWLGLHRSRTRRVFRSITGPHVRD